MLRIGMLMCVRSPSPFVLSWSTAEGEGAGEWEEAAEQAELREMR